MGSVREFPMHFPLLISSQPNVFFCQSFLLLFVVSTILTAGHIFSLMSIMSAIKVRSTRKKQKTWEEGKKLESNFRKYKRWGNVTSLVEAAAGNALLIGWAVKAREESVTNHMGGSLPLFTWSLHEDSDDPRKNGWTWRVSATASTCYELIHPPVKRERMFPPAKAPCWVMT